MKNRVLESSLVRKTSLQYLIQVSTSNGGQSDIPDIGRFATMDFNYHIV